MDPWNPQSCFHRMDTRVPNASTLGSSELLANAIFPHKMQECLLPPLIYFPETLEFRCANTFQNSYDVQALGYLYWSARSQNEKWFLGDALPYLICCLLAFPSLNVLPKAALFVPKLLFSRSILITNSFLFNTQ